MNDEILVMDEETYLSVNGASWCDLGNFALHHNKGRNGDKAWSKMVDAQAQKDRDLVERRAVLRAEYREKVAAGELRPPTHRESTISKARGDETLESVQAARRICEKRGYDWRGGNE